MNNYNYWSEDLNCEDYIEHHGIFGQKWGVRKYQYEDGSLTPEGRRRYLKSDGSLTRAGKKELARRNKILDYGQAADFADKYYSSTPYGETAVRKGLSDEQYAKYKNSGQHDNWADWAKYRDLGLYNFAQKYYKTKVSDLDDLSYKKYEKLFYSQDLKGLLGKDMYTNYRIKTLKEVMSNHKYTDPDNAIQDYGKEPEWVSSHSPYNLVTTDKNGKAVRTPIQANTAEEAVDAYIKLLNKKRH